MKSVLIEFTKSKGYVPLRKAWSEFSDEVPVMYKL